MKVLALGLSLAVCAGCGMAYAADLAAQPDHGRAGPGMASVTRAQAQEMAVRMFEWMDFNHDGKLDPSDREGRRAEFQQAMFERIDANHDGQISRDEFMNFKPARPHGPPDGTPHGPPDGPGPGMGGHDMHGPMGGPGMEGSGMVGPGGPGGEGPPMGMGMHGPGMGGMMAQMADANHDGSVSRDEFMAAFARHFDRMDANHDGTVTPAERRAAHEAMRQHMHDRMGGPEGTMPPPPEGAMPPPPEGD